MDDSCWIDTYPSTSINDIDNNHIKLERPVIARIEQSRIVEFIGEDNTAKSVKTQYQRVGERVWVAIPLP
ncbi:MAG: hypothetical protein CM1200mP18_13010 [Gammaproteobacteria bacterium]|nr:MAG: hypothetical protein CM1200mP18_13010 [Gammaproteobacteria bacterium]